MLAEDVEPVAVMLVSNFPFSVCGTQYGVPVFVQFFMFGGLS